MADTTVYTVSAGYLPFFAYAHSDFDVSNKITSGQRRQTAAGGVKWDGVELKGPESIMPDGSLRKAKIRGSVGWFEFSKNMRPIYDIIKTEEMLRERMNEMAKEFYNRDLGGLSEQLLQSFINSGFLGEIEPTGDILETGQQGTPEELFNPQEGGQDFRVTHPSKDDVTLAGRANTVDMYISDRDGHIYRLDVTAMTMDSKSAHHGLSAHKDRVESGVTGKQLMEDIREGGHLEGSQAQKKLWNYFKKLQDQNWNPMIQKLKDHAYQHGDKATKDNMDALHQGRTSLNKLGTDFLNSLTEIRGGTKGQAAAKISPHISARTKELKTLQGDWDRRYKKYKRYANNLISSTLGRSAVTETWSSSLEFVLHALGNMVEIASRGGGQFGGKEYGYSTGMGLGEGLAGNFVVEVMHRINTKGNNVLLFKNLRSQDVLIHNEAQLTHVYRNKILGLAREDTQAVHEQEAIRQNSLFSGNIITEGASSIEIGGITTSAMNQVSGEPSLGYAAVVTDTKINKDIERFINTLHGDPKKIRKMLGTKGKTINLTDRFKSYEKMWEDPHVSKNTSLGRGSSALWKAQAMSGGNWDPLTYFGNEKVAGLTGVQAGAKMMGHQLKRMRARELSGFATGSFKGSGVEAWEGAGGMAAGLFNPALQQLGRGTGQSSRFGDRHYWGLNKEMGALMKQHWDENTSPDFWAAPYLTLLYPSMQVSVKGE